MYLVQIINSMNHLIRGRYSILLSFIAYFLICSFIIRSLLFILSIPHADFTFFEIIRCYFVGLCFDAGTALIITSFYALYLLLLPDRLYRQKWNRVLTLSVFFIFVVITLFSFFAEITFWQEFESRFNFIAVDYLIYTYEVIHNINESYPLPYLISGIVAIALIITYLFNRLKIFSLNFESKLSFKKRFIYTASLMLTAILFSLFVKNSAAEQGNNRYTNELSKAGIYAFFAAFKNNELNYHEFYQLMDSKKAFAIVRNQLSQKDAIFKKGLTILRNIKGTDSAYRPNVIMITVESLSAEFLAHYGNKQQLTPRIDALADSSVFFSDMYATGTRTVRGMEALTLSIPPTPGSSIIRRDDNENLFTVGHVFKENGYINTFFYGGDGYFDNMNHFFGNNGYNIVDRGRKLLDETYQGSRKLIADQDVTFENAWGICDEDIFNVALKDADEKYQHHQLFNDFIMTTSNHRPFTFPANKIKLPPGTREAAVRYTDYAIGKFIDKIKTRPYFKNTIIIIVADHCASSAGKNEVDISKYQIPGMIINLKQQQPINISKMTSQIDLFPTLWHLLGWDYNSEFYGQNVLADHYQPRVFLGTYQKLAYLKGDSLLLLSPHRKVDTYLYDKSKNLQIPHQLSKKVINEGIANYQTAFDLFKDGKLRL